MGKRLQKEGGQAKPSGSREEEVFLNIQRTAEALMRGVAETLKPSGLTPTQYNVLRILRGAGTDGLPCRNISERMVNHDPDVTRLLDRLEAQGLIGRSRDGKDRRVVLSHITPQGLKLLESLDEPVVELHRRQLKHMERAHLETLSGLLETAREQAG